MYPIEKEKPWTIKVKRDVLKGYIKYFCLKCVVFESVFISDIIVTQFRYGLECSNILKPKSVDIAITNNYVFEGKKE